MCVQIPRCRGGGQATISSEIGLAGPGPDGFQATLRTFEGRTMAWEVVHISVVHISVHMAWEVVLILPFGKQLQDRGF